MVKTVINTEGQQIEVADDVAVKTVNGIHYLLTEQEESEMISKEAIWVAGAPERHNAEAKANRAEAYRNESDPYFFKWQRGEDGCTEQGYLALIEEIKQRFPYIEE